MNDTQRLRALLSDALVLMRQAAWHVDTPPLRSVSRRRSLRETDVTMQERERVRIELCQRIERELG